MVKKTKNSLGQLYDSQPHSVRSKIREDIKACKINPNIDYWLRKPDQDLIKMPVIRRDIFVKNIPEAEKLFTTPSC